MVSYMAQKIDFREFGLFSHFFLILLIVRRAVPENFLPKNLPKFSIKSTLKRGFPSKIDFLSPVFTPNTPMPWGWDQFSGT